MTLRQSPLRAEHEQLGAKVVEFSGWEMPLSYPAGTIAEHLACRREAAVFDVSHLGTVRVSGPEAFAALQRALSNDIGSISPGRAQYTHLLDEDGSVLDDIIVWWVTPESFDVMPNASNTDRVRGALEGMEGISVQDVTAERALIALQGPRSGEVLARVAPGAAGTRRFRVAELLFAGTACRIAGTGYTGEPGFELFVPVPAAAELFGALVEAGAEPAGLGARDTLRLEAGLPLYGHELGPGITPLDAGLSRFVGWDKPEFSGREALLRIRRAGGPHRRLAGLVTDGRRPPRSGDRVLSEGRATGEVTSGNYSPVLGRGIALAFLPVDMAEGEVVEIEARAQRLPARVVAPPFFRLDAASLGPVAPEPKR